MKTNLKVAIWIIVSIAATAVAGLGYYRLRHRELQYLTGVILRQDPDPGKQLPIAGAQIKLLDGGVDAQTLSDANGLFKLKLPSGIRSGDAATLQLSEKGYRTQSLDEYLEDRLYVLRMVPNAVAPVAASPANGAIAEPIDVADIRIRYSVPSETSTDVGSAIKTFEVKNIADVPCNNDPPCSPDGKWKAAIGGASLDAGEGATFHDARVTCIAGPCPFTQIENDSFSAGGHMISVAVRNWSDTVTFVLEAQVMRTLAANIIRQSFPVVFNDVMSFTLPAAADGLSIEATVDGSNIVFPLGPALKLSWATCSVNPARNGTRLYRCELKPGYRFGSGVPGIKSP